MRDKMQRLLHPNMLHYQKLVMALIGQITCFPVLAFRSREHVLERKTSVKSHRLGGSWHLFRFQAQVSDFSEYGSEQSTVSAK